MNTTTAMRMVWLGRVAMAEAPEAPIFGLSRKPEPEPQQEDTAFAPPTDEGGVDLFDEDLCVMEIKIPGAAPMWLTQILSELKIYPTSFSKYGRCYQKLMTRRREEQQRLEAPCYAG